MNRSTCHCLAEASLADDAARPLAFDFRAVVKVLDGWRDLLRGESKSVVAERSKKSRYHHG